MGLDGVEIVMDLEERFRMHLSDEDVGRVRTVRELAGLVTARLGEGSSPDPAAAAFWEWFAREDERHFERDPYRTLSVQPHPDPRPITLPRDPRLRAKCEALILLSVRRTVARQLGLPLDVVRPDADFVEDLRIDR